jgi:hypothetical protein
VRLRGVGLLWALASAAAAAPSAFERDIASDAPGRVSLRLDRDVYEGARADLGDLRVVDARGRDVPYVIDGGLPGLGCPEEMLVPRWSEAQDEKARETWLTLDLGARHQPFLAVEIDVVDERFFRQVRVEARRDAAAHGQAPKWEEIARGEIHRLEREGQRHECLAIEARGRGRALRVRVQNRDDRPLQVRAVRVRVPVERLLFEVSSPGGYRLTYGSADREKPSYDLARTAGDIARWGASARPAHLGPPRRLAADRQAELPWTERHPSLLWGGLLAVVLALGALTYGALRRAG